MKSLSEPCLLQQHFGCDVTGVLPRLKQEILSLRDSRLVLIRLTELKQRMEMTLRREHFELAELEAVVLRILRKTLISRAWL